MPDVLQLDDQFPIVAEAERAAGPRRVLKSEDTFGVFDRYGDVSGTEAVEQGLGTADAIARDPDEAGDVLAALTELELIGLVRRAGAGRYVRRP